MNVRPFVCNHTLAPLYIYQNTTGCNPPNPIPGYIYLNTTDVVPFCMQYYPNLPIHLSELSWMLYLPNPVPGYISQNTFEFVTFLWDPSLSSLYIYLNTTGCYLPNHIPGYNYLYTTEFLSFCMQPYHNPTIHLPEQYWMVCTQTYSIIHLPKHN